METLAQEQRTKKHESVLKTRRKIGLGRLPHSFVYGIDVNRFPSFFAGIAISRELDGVWLYNRANVPIFVHSPTLSDIENRCPTVIKVLPGRCIRAYEVEK